MFANAAVQKIWETTQKRDGWVVCHFRIFSILCFPLFTCLVPRRSSSKLSRKFLRLSSPVSRNKSFPWFLTWLLGQFPHSFSLWEAPPLHPRHGAHDRARACHPVPVCCWCGPRVAFFYEWFCLIINRSQSPRDLFYYSSVPYLDDNGAIQVNRGFRVQYNGAIGPYKVCFLLIFFV